MARKLPWKRKSAVGSNPPQRRPATNQPDATEDDATSVAGISRVMSNTTPRGQSIDRPRNSASKQNLSARPKRSPSTSPPPQPPPEEYMIDGFDNDDGYRMVEDELRTVAGHFTAHLHAAEYQRMKTLSRNQNADAIRHISRPVSGLMTDYVRRRRNISSQAKTRKEGLRQALARRGMGLSDHDDDGDETLGVGTSLQGLMNNSRKSNPPLTALTTIMPGARKPHSGIAVAPAAKEEAGLTARRRLVAKEFASPNGSDGSENDLDRAATFLSHRQSHPKPQSRKPSSADTVTKRAGTRLAVAASTISHKYVQSVGDDDSTSSEEIEESDDDGGPSTSRQQGQRHHQRRTEIDERQKKGTHHISLDTIPSFF